LLAVATSGIALKFVPEKLINLLMCETAIENDGLALQYALSVFKQLPNNIIINAISQNGYALRFIEESKRTQQMCNIAVENEPYAICFVPSKYRTVQLMSDAIKTNPTVATLILNIDELDMINLTQ
jgi:hypothetical protein